MYPSVCHNYSTTTPTTTTTAATTTTTTTTTTLVGVEKQDFTSLFHIYLRAFDYIKQSSSGLKDRRNN